MSRKQKKLDLKLEIDELTKAILKGDLQTGVNCPPSFDDCPGESPEGCSPGDPSDCPGNSPG